MRRSLAEIAKNSLKTRYFGIQGRSRSSILLPPESSCAVLVMISSNYVSICNRFHARLVNGSRNRAFEGVPKFDAILRRTPWT